jgi:glycosyltransferase involved in cell wall biosynthesis
MRVQIVDPPAYTPPYDRSLCAALARAEGAPEVELVTSAFAYDEVAPADGYEVSEPFYRRASKAAPGPRRRALRGAEHLGDMLRFRSRDSQRADVAHFQWLAMPRLDRHLLPRDRPLVMTPHGLLRGDARGSMSPYAPLLRRMDALVALSEYGAGVLRERAGVDPERIRVIPHGPLDYLTRLPDPAPLPSDLAAAEGPVVLYFGLIRPYKGVDVLLEAFREIEGAELWVVGRPMGVDLAQLAEAAGRCRSTVRLVPRFVPDRELPAIFRRADLVVLPHRQAEQSGVLFTAIAFGKAVLMSDVGGFPEVAKLGAGQTFAAGDAQALAQELKDLLRDDAQRQRLAAGALDAAGGAYSWDEIARQHVALYEELLGR